MLRMSNLVDCFGNWSTSKKIEVSFVHKERTKKFMRDYFALHHICVNEVTFEANIMKGDSIYTNVYTLRLPRKLDYTKVIEELASNKNMVSVRSVPA